MFNIFKKKRNKLDNAIIVEKYVLDIHYKNTTMNSFIDDGDTLPLNYRKLFNWYFCRDSELYCLRYANGGLLIVNRNEISKINMYRKEVSEEVKVECKKKYNL